MCVSPRDVYLAFGVNTHAIRERRLYLPWEAGKPPDWVLEVASVSHRTGGRGPQAGHLCPHRRAGILALRSERWRVSRATAGRGPTGGWGI